MNSAAACLLAAGCAFVGGGCRPAPPGELARARRFAAEVNRLTGPDNRVVLHRDLPERAAVRDALVAGTTEIDSLDELPALLAAHPRLVLLTNSRLDGADRPILVELIRHHPARAIDHRLLIDLGSSAPDLREYQFVEGRWPRRAHLAERAGSWLVCAYADSGLTPPADLPEAEPPPASEPERAACYYNFQLLRGDDRRTRAAVERWRTFDNGDGALGGREQALGSSARILGWRPHRDGGAELWWTIDGPLAGATMLRWRLVPEPGGEGAPRVEEHAAWKDPWGRAPRPGMLIIDQLAFTPPGRYRVSVELGPAAPAPAIAKAELGTLSR